SLVERNPRIALNLIARLTELLHKLNRLVEDLSLTDITTRLANYLVKMVDERKQTEGQPNLILSEKKSVLASQLGTIPETLSRSLAKLTREKIIIVIGSQIKVLDLKRLRQMAGEYL
ncbi:MAG: Crp/Fnr family transcriptional regulator, partial [Candidatus Zixiibacteriota bacterium]